MTRGSSFQNVGLAKTIRTVWTLLNRFHWEFVGAWGRGKQDPLPSGVFEFVGLVVANDVTRWNSLGWLELRTILAKLFFSYDLKLKNNDVDWHRDSRMHTLWNKPKLIVKVARH